MRIKSIIVGLLLVLVTVVRADASTFDFTMDSAAYDVTGQITTNGNLVTGINGNVTGLLSAPISGLDGQPNALFTSDNLVFSTQPYVTNLGVLFDAGGFVFNVYSVANGSTFNYYIASNQFGADFFSNPLFNPGSLIIDATATAVTPLPSSLFLFAPVLGTLFLLGWYKNRKSAASIRPAHSIPEGASVASGFAC